MRVFLDLDVEAAIVCAAEGGQALHLHSWVPDTAHRVFREAKARGEPIAHLFDRDRERLVATARSLGVRVIYVDKDGTYNQHIDLAGRPLRQCRGRIAESDVQLFDRRFAGERV